MLAESIKVMKKRAAENTNRTYRIFLVLFICSMLVFTTSKIWLPSDVKIQNTEIGTEKDVTAATKLRLQSWKYNQAAGFMEVAFDVQDSDSSQIGFLPQAHTNRARTTALKADVAYNNDGLLIIQISAVPKSWDVLSLWIKGQVSADSETAEVGTTAENGVNFLCDVRRVAIDNSLKPSSDLIYALKSIDNQIAQVNSNIAAAKKEIEKKGADMKQLDFDISALKANQKYQTPDEVKQSNSAIQTKTSQIQNLKNAVADDQNQIANCQEKLKKLKQKRDDTRNGKFSEPTEKNSSAGSGTSSVPVAPFSKNAVASAAPHSKSSSVPITVD